MPLGQILQSSNVAYMLYIIVMSTVALSPDDCSPMESSCHCLWRMDNWMNINFSLFGNKKKRFAVSKFIESMSQEPKTRSKTLV